MSLLIMNGNNDHKKDSKDGTKKDDDKMSTDRMASTKGGGEEKEELMDYANFKSAVTSFPSGYTSSYKTVKSSTDKVTKDVSKSPGSPKREKKEKRDDNLNELIDDDRLAANFSGANNREITKKYRTQNKTQKEVNEILLNIGYVLERQLGKGSFGVVRRGLNQKTNQRVAIKMISLSTTDVKKKEKQMIDLKHELYVLENVRHPNIIEMYEHFMIDNTMYIVMGGCIFQSLMSEGIVMSPAVLISHTSLSFCNPRTEYADDGSLSEFLRKKGSPLSESRARRWFKQIASAVNEMHVNNVAHRDLKIANVLLKRHRNPDGSVMSDGRRICKLCDFGLSRASWDKYQGVLMCRSYCGTVQYMSPEVIKLHPHLTKTMRKSYNPMIADIWSLGVCLFNMLTRTYPFDPKKQTLLGCLDHMKKSKYTIPPNIKLSTDACHLLRNMLEPDVVKRITFQGIFSHPWLTSTK